MDAAFGSKCELNLLKTQNTAVGITIAIKNGIQCDSSSSET